MKRSLGNMDFILNLFGIFSISLALALSSSIGSEFETSLTCSKFHFEENVLEKLVRLEHTMQNLEKKMDAWENSITSKLDEMKNVKKLTERFVQTLQNDKLQDQIKFNESYQEIVQHFKTRAKNETDSYGDQMNALLESVSSKMQLFTEAEEKRESVKELMQSSFHEEQKRLNTSYNKIVETFKVNSNRTLHEVISKHEKGYAEKVENRNLVAFSVSRTRSQSLSSGTKVLFDQVWTNEGNGYQPRTGIFIAPRAGLYHITAVVMSGFGGILSLRLYHNKIATSGSYLQGDGYKTGTFDVVFNLQMADEVYVAGYGKIKSDSGTYLTFSGHIIV